MDRYIPIQACFCIHNCHLYLHLLILLSFHHFFDPPTQTLTTARMAIQMCVTMTLCIHTAEVMKRAPNFVHDAININVESNYNRV